MKLWFWFCLALVLWLSGVAIAQTPLPTPTVVATAIPVVNPDNGPMLPTSGTWGWVVTILLAFNVLLSALVKIVEGIAVKTTSTGDDKAAGFLTKLAGWVAWLLRIIGAAPSTPTILRK